jgi:hypothetical protein
MGVLACSVLSFKGNLAGWTPCLHDYKLLIEPLWPTSKKLKKAYAHFLLNPGKVLCQIQDHLSYNI